MLWKSHVVTCTTDTLQDLFVKHTHFFNAYLMIYNAIQNALLLDGWPTSQKKKRHRCHHDKINAFWNIFFHSHKSQASLVQSKKPKAHFWANSYFSSDNSRMKTWLITEVLDHFSLSGEPSMRAELMHLNSSAYSNCCLTIWFDILMFFHHKIYVPTENKRFSY